MSLSKLKYTPSYDFPEEILSEIFKRLPVKSVLCCLSVQKSWYSLIKSPMFVTLHHNHQKLTAPDGNPKYLLFRNTSTHLLTVYSDDKQFEKYFTLEYPFDFNIHEWSAVSNGLICVSSVSYRKPDYDYDIYLFNPLDQMYNLIHVSPLYVFTPEEIEWKALAFGYLPEIDDYVVVLVVKLEPFPDPVDPSDPDSPDPYEFNPHTVGIGVYSLNTGSWSTIFQDDVLLFSLCSDKSVFVNGTAFWVAEKIDQYVMFFDTKKEILREILVPAWFEVPECQFLNPVIHPFGQSIAYFVENDESHHLDIWVLKEDMVDEFSWEKKMSVSLSENIRANVLGIRNNGDPILANSNNLISYDLDTHESYDFVNSCDCLTPNSSYEGSKPPFVITPFVETLLWLEVSKRFNSAVNRRIEPSTNPVNYEA